MTTLTSTAKEYKLGLKDPGQFSIDVNYNIWDDPGQEALWGELNNNVPIQVKVRVPGHPGARLGLRRAGVELRDARPRWMIASPGRSRSG